MNFVELCEEVGLWSSRNFGNQIPENPLLGVLEEVGEISHSFLKSLQGIRGSQEEHLEAMRDGVGDALVFLADFCYRADLVKSFVGREYLDGPFEEMLNQYSLSQNDKTFGPRRHLFKAAQQLGRIYDYYTIREAVSYGIHIEILLSCFVGFCQTMGFNFAECVMTTWNLVKQRDWTKNKQTGQVE